MVISGKVNSHCSCISTTNAGYAETIHNSVHVLAEAVTVSTDHWETGHIAFLLSIIYQTTFEQFTQKINECDHPRNAALLKSMQALSDSYFKKSPDNVLDLFGTIKLKLHDIHAGILYQGTSTGSLPAQYNEDLTNFLNEAGITSYRSAIRAGRITSYAVSPLTPERLLQLVTSIQEVAQSCQAIGFVPLTGPAQLFRKVLEVCKLCLRLPSMGGRPPRAKRQLTQPPLPVSSQPALTISAPIVPIPGWASSSATPAPVGVSIRSSASSSAPVVPTSDGPSS